MEDGLNTIYENEAYQIPDPVAQVCDLRCVCRGVG